MLDFVEGDGDRQMFRVSYSRVVIRDAREHLAHIVSLLPQTSERSKIHSCTGEGVIQTAKGEVLPGFEPGLPEDFVNGTHFKIRSDNHYTIKPRDSACR